VNTNPFKPEQGSSLRVLRWKRYIAADERTFLEQVKAFSSQYGVAVSVEHLPWPEVFAENFEFAARGKGPDLVISCDDDGNRFADKLLPLDDVAKALEGTLGGFFDAARFFSKPSADTPWISLPQALAANALVVRESVAKRAGFTQAPKDLDAFAAFLQALHKTGMPAGFAFGNSPSDGQAFCSWLLWSFGGQLLNAKDEVVIDSPATEKALSYAKKIYPSLHPDVLQWRDVHNNLEYLNGKLSATYNGMNIYHTALSSEDPALEAIAKDSLHWDMPLGLDGKSYTNGMVFNMMVPKYCKFPNAAKALLTHLMQPEQQQAWLSASFGYLSAASQAVSKREMPAQLPNQVKFFQRAGETMRPCAYGGRPGFASAVTRAQLLVVKMFAETLAGQPIAKVIARTKDRAQKAVAARKSVAFSF
jgi:multiple sugar transport system substrate-binding protein